MAKKIKMRALLVTTTPKKQYIIQRQHKFLFFKWWETYKKGDNGLWNYGDLILSKEKIEEIFEIIEEHCQQKGYEFSTEIIDQF